MKTRDGIADVAISAVNYASSIGTQGRVYVVFGDTFTGGVWGEGGIFGLYQLGTASSWGWTIEGAGGYQLGASLAVANFTTSAHADLAIGMPGLGYDVHYGTVWLVQGGDGTEAGNRLTVFENGLVGSQATLIYHAQTYPYYDSSYSLQQLSPSIGFGKSLAAVDLSGDGLADLVIGSPGTQYVYDYSSTLNVWALPNVIVAFSNQNGWGEGTYNGLLNGADSNRFQFGAPTASTPTNITPSPSGGYLGRTVANIGDINGDGYPDVAIVQPYGGEVGGRNVFVVFGRSGYTGFPAIYGALTGTDGFVLVDSNNNHSFGTSAYEVHVAAAGDVNGDGVADLLVGHRRSDRDSYLSGRVYVVFGNSGTSTPWSGGLFDMSSLTASQGLLLIAPEYVEIGSLLATDVNGDGINDVLIGSDDAQLRRYDTSTSSYYTYDTGAVFVVFGGSSLTSMGSVYMGEMSVSYGFTAFGPIDGNIAGPMIVADVNGDTFQDILVAGSMYYYSYGVSGYITNNRIYVIFGQDPASAPVIPPDTSSQVSVTASSWD